MRTYLCQYRAAVRIAVFAMCVAATVSSLRATVAMEASGQTAIATATATANAMATGDARDQFENAVREYRAALETTDRDERLTKFRHAELLFRQILQGEHDGAGQMSYRSPELYMNWGNSALGAEQLGPAILAFRRCLTLEPGHERARQNLRYARSLLPDWVPRADEQAIVDSVMAWPSRQSTSRLQLFASIAFLIAAMLAAAAIKFRLSSLLLVACIPALAWGGLVGYCWLHRVGGAERAAVVMTPEVIVRSADSAGAPARFAQPVPSGTELEVLEVRDQWVRARFFDNREGWLPRSSVDFVESESSQPFGS